VSNFDSEASRINFWKDINTKDHNYATDMVVIKDKDHSKKDEKGGHYSRNKSKGTSGKANLI
jgi:hypothetical protein